MLDALAGVRRGGPVNRRDPGPWLLFWMLAVLFALSAIFALASISWAWGIAALVFAAAMTAAATRALAATRTPGWQARRELLTALRTLSVLPDGGGFFLNRESHLLYEVKVKSARLLPLWPVQVISVNEFSEEALHGLAERGSAHVTGRSFELLPWESAVRLTVRDATFSQSDDSESRQLTFRQWFPDERSVAGWVRRTWRGQRAGSLFASPQDVRDIAGRLAAAESVSPDAM